MSPTKQNKQLEIVEPIGTRVLIRKDEDKKTTKGGIQLPGNIEIPTITGRIVARVGSSQPRRGLPDQPVRQGCCSTRRTPSRWISRVTTGCSSFRWRTSSPCSGVPRVETPASNSTIIHILTSDKRSGVPAAKSCVHKGVTGPIVHRL